jgi:hypothetical protein
MALMIQMLPNATDVATPFPTLVYPAFRRVANIRGSTIGSNSIRIGL